MLIYRYKDAYAISNMVLKLLCLNIWVRVKNDNFENIQVQSHKSSRVIAQNLNIAIRHRNALKIHPDFNS